MLTPEQFAYYTFFHHRRQEPLGAPFAHILDKHVDELRVRDDQAPNTQPDPIMQTKMSDELGRAMEDYVSTIIDSWDETRQATAYLYLNKSGMTLERARTIRVKAGLSD